MKKTILRVLISIWVVLFAIGCSPTSQEAAPAKSGSDSSQTIAQGENTGTYWPTTGWRTCRPEAVGMDSKKLAKAIEYAAKPQYKIDGVLVVKDGYIVAEAYFGAFKKNSQHVSNSMAKSFSSALVGIAIDKGLIPNVDARICEYYDEWDCDDPDDLRRKISLRHAMTLTSGLKWHEDWTKWDFATNDALKMGASGYFKKYMAARKGLHEPGQRFYYSTGDPMLLSGVIRKATGKTAFEFAKPHLFEPLNITNVRWDSDKAGYTATAWGLHTTVRNYAKFGYLFLNKGRWEDKQIVSEKWVEKSTRTDPSVRMWPAYGYLWHVNLPMRLRAWKSKIPADGYMAEGVLGQNIFIIPSKDLVVVKVANSQGGHPDPNPAKFLTMILDSME